MNESLDRTDEFPIEEVREGLEKERVKVDLPEWYKLLLLGATKSVKGMEVFVKWVKPHMNRFWNKIRPRFWMILGATVLILLFILFAWWLGKVAERATDVTTNALGSIPPYVWWWAIGTPLVLVLIWLFLRSPKAREYGTRIKFKWVLATAIVVMAVFRFYPFNNNDNGSGENAVSAFSTTNVLDSSGNFSGDFFLPIAADCESGDCTPGSARQFNPDGSVVTNVNEDSSVDIGKWQINSIHEERAKSMGHDIWTEEGNTAFARVLFSESGTEPWNSSRKLWEPMILALNGGNGGGGMYEALLEKPVVIVVPPGYRSDMVGKLPTEHLLSSTYFDKRGNLIWTIGVTPPSRKAVMQIATTKCKNLADCKR